MYIYLDLQTTPFSAHSICILMEVLPQNAGCAGSNSDAVETDTANENTMTCDYIGIEY